MNKRILYNLIENEEKELQKSTLSSSSRLNHINTIIRIKKDIYTEKNTYENEIYNDLKSWLKYYIISCDENHFGYDVFDKVLIESIIKLVSHQKQIQLYDFLIRQLKINSYPNNEIIWCETKIKKTEIFLFLTSCNPIDLLKVLFLLSSYNLVTLVVSSLLFLVFVNIVFLPKEYLGIEVFELTYEPYYKDNFLLNHILNVTNHFFNFSNGNFKIHLNTICDLILLIILKIAFYLIILNFIIREISRSIRKYD